MKYPNRIKKEAASGQRISSLERSVMRLASMRAIAPKTQSTSPPQPKMDTIAQFFADAIKRVDPDARLDEMSRDQVVKEGRDVIYLALETLQENIARHERADSTIAGDDRIVMVSLSTLAAYGIDASQLELYDSNPRMDTSSPTKRVMRWNGLRIGITHEANQDYRFGKKVGVSYGRLYGSYGDASDRRSHDFMIGDKLDNPKIHAIQQLTPEGMRDEVKYGIGFESPQEFKQVYQMQLPANLREAMFGGVWEVEPSELDKYREDLPSPHNDSAEECDRLGSPEEELPPKKSEGGEVPPVENRGDAEDEKDIADVITEKSQSDKRLTATLSNWSSQILSVVKGAGSLLGAVKALENGDGYDAMDDTKLIALLGQTLILSHLAGMDEVGDETNLDSLIRMDAPRLPEWLKLPFREGINAFKKKIAIPTASYKQMQEGYHDWAFSIAKMTKASMLNDAKWVIQRGMEDGTSYEAMIKQWNRLIGRQGWKAGENRIYTILDTNIRSAQASGRAQQMYDPDIINSRPYAIWRWRDSPNPRPHHQALHNKAIALENPFWDRCRNPAGWGCRCSTFSASKEFCDRNGIEILDNPPDPELIADPGFRFPLRGLSDTNRREIINQTLDTLPPALRKKVEADVNRRRD